MSNFINVLTSLIFGANIRTMWMTPFYLFFGLFFIYIFKSNINLNYLKRFMIVFYLFLFFHPYLFICLFQKITKELIIQVKKLLLVQNRWDKNFTNKIALVVGDEWLGGNLSYHLQSRPRWFNNLILN